MALAPQKINTESGVAARPATPNIKQVASIKADHKAELASKRRRALM